MRLRRDCRSEDRVGSSSEEGCSDEDAEVASIEKRPQRFSATGERVGEVDMCDVFLRDWGLACVESRIESEERDHLEICWY